MIKKLLVIPDSHAKPGVSNDRYEWLGKYILDQRPDVIVNIGDHGDMPSLCHYDKGTKGFEGRRYKDDVAAVNDSLERLHGPIEKYNKRRRKNRKALYAPDLHYCMGNHENRINRAISVDAAHLEGIIHTDDLKFKEHGWKVHPFLEPVRLGGVSFAHYFPSGVMGRPIGGVNAAASLIAKTMTSSVVGHSHLRDFAERTDPYGKKIMGLVSGCYFDHDEEYAGQVNKMYWRGVAMLHNVHEGEYEHEWVTLKTLRESYG